MKSFLPLVLLILILLSYVFTNAQPNLWTDISEAQIVQVGERYIIPLSYRTVTLNLDQARPLLSSAPMEFTPASIEGKSIIPLPMPDGTFQQFKFWESPTMEPELQAQYPEIRTYTGQGIDDPYATLKFDFTPHGFHAQILSPNGRVFIDPYSKGDINHYISYYTRDFVKQNVLFECQVFDDDNYEPNYLPENLLTPTGPQLRTYRLANAATGEYTTFHGGTVPLGLAAVTTSVNRVNGVYEREVAVRMILVANNNLIIYTNAATDPYTNNNGSTMLGQNISNLSSVIGNANFDIGHVFSTGGGGVAYLGVVCGTNKAGGVTGQFSPIGDPFDIDYVAHEMGHQFNARHTFNGNAGSCSGSNRNPSTAYEPGSGSTILAYAGICSPQNLQSNSDPYFHVISFDEIVAFTNSGSGNGCAVITSTGNSAPIVTVPSGGFTIPKSTPFALTGSATDPNGDAITYSWEEFDLGPAGAPTAPSGDAPIFRSFVPSTSPTRTFPKLSDLLNNTSTIGEILPTYARNLKFRLTVRDNRAGGGGVDWKQINFTVDGNSGPFVVTSPNTNVSWLGNTQQTVTWNVANTNASPVNCANVRILLSTNGGNSFNTVLLESTPNDGSQVVTIPNLPTSQARIKVEAAGNIFFDISNVNFTIINNPTVVNPVSFNALAISSSQINLTFTPNASNNNVVIVWNLSGTFTTPAGTPPTPGSFFAGGTLLYNGTSSPQIHSGLNFSTTYYYKAFSYNGTNYSPGLTAQATTDCPVFSIPFIETFDAVMFPPNCWTRINAGLGNNWERTTSTTYSGAGAMVYEYSTTQAADAWMITPGINLENGKKYILYFFQRVADSGFPEKLKVTVGNAPIVAAQTTTIWDNAGGSNLFNTTYLLRTAQFNCTSTGTYYFGFNSYSDADMFNLYVDQIIIIEGPANDIGVISLNYSNTLENIVSTGLSREGYETETSIDNKLKLQNISVSTHASQNNNFIESSPVNFKAAVQNFGSATQNSYQVGWEIDGVQQTSVSNTLPLVSDGIDSLTLIWSVPQTGLHTIRAWTILGTDTNPSNDTSSVFSFYVSPSSSIFFEGFEGIFPPPDWIRLNADGGGTTGPWFAGNQEIFPAPEGIGYAAANFQGANGFYIDEWLITPNTGGVSENGSVDSLTFWVRSPDGSAWTDSLEIRVSVSGTNPEDFTTLLEYIEVPLTWSRYAYALPDAATRYIAFRYLHYDGGSSGNNSNYIGLDMVEVTTHSTSSSTFPLTVTVEDGWNMVSVPGLHPTDQNVNTWWSDRNPLADVYKWSGGYSPVTLAAPSEGYWMLHSGANTYNTGDEWPAGGIQIVAHDPIPIITGWNMIGAYEQNLPVSGLTTSPPGLIVPGTVYGWNGTYYSPTNLEPGYGYWILASGNGVINATVTEGGTAAKQDNKEDWGRITVTDASGKKYTLYSVSGEVNLDHYQMPPFPPAGSFDVRYSSGRAAEDLKSGNQTIEMRGMEYPVRVRVENANIRLQDETGREINSVLKPGEEISINNSFINKLILSEDIIPYQYSLYQNYPNPFNPSTQIRYSIPAESLVTLKIYNSIGEEVTTLVNEQKDAGNYTVDFASKGLASGIYLYKLTAGEFTDTKKMILLK